MGTDPLIEQAVAAAADDKRYKPVTPLDSIVDHAKQNWSIGRRVVWPLVALSFLSRWLLPHLDLVLPLTVLTIGSAMLLIHWRWKPLLFSDGTLNWFCVWTFLSTIFAVSQAFNAGRALAITTGALFAWALTSLWMITFAVNFAFVIFTMYERAKVHLMVFGLAAAALGHFLQMTVAANWVLRFQMKALLERFPLNDPLRAGPSPDSEEYLNDLATKLAAAVPFSAPPSISLFETYGWHKYYAADAGQGGGTPE